MNTDDRIEISKFFDHDFRKFAAYDSLRSMANYIDGLKISARKAIWVVLNMSNFKKIKVSQLAAEVAKVTNYVHGEGSMQSVITNLAKNYTGSNNINLLEPDGNFGSRYDETPSAPRYIFVGKEKILDEIFDSDDLKIVEEQYFEGTKIEPRFLIPNLPLLLVNGSDGIGTGFRQVILPRNPVELIKLIEDYLSGKELPSRITPWYKGFTGNIVADTESECNTWIVSGKARYVNDTTIIIEELPIGYDLNSYISVLEDLKDKGKIRNFTDLSENEVFKFEVKVTRSSKTLSETELLEQFKLIKRTYEIFSCIDENNKIVEFENEIDILKNFIRVKLEYTEKRRQYLLNRYKNDITLIKNKLKFIKAIHEETIDVRKDSKNVISKLEELGFDKISDSYSYLLDLKISSLNMDRFNELKLQAKKLIESYEILSNTEAKTLFLTNLAEVKMKFSSVGNKNSND